MILYTTLVILLSSYVGTSSMPDDTKTSYFVVVGILTSLILLFSFIA